MSVRLYGRAVGHGSLSVVTSGFREVLEGTGLLEGFVALDKSGGDEEQDSPPGALARDGVFTGNLQFVPLMRRGARHERHWVQVTPNSNHIPRNLLASILDLSTPRILSASAWGSTMISGALHEMGFRYIEDGNVWCTYVAEGKSVEIHTMGHGVSGFAPVPEELAIARADFENGEFRVIHFSTTDGERKGTLELIQAWQLLEKMLPSRPELLLVLDHHANAALQQRMRDLGIAPPSSVRILTRGDMDAKTMSRVLCHMHVVAAPSRGEGFGLCLKNGTLVTTRHGTAPIETVRYGDEVLAHDGKYRVVTAAKQRRSCTLRVEVTGALGLDITKEHRVLCAGVRKGELFRHFRPSAPFWITAGELTKNHYLVIRSPLEPEKRRVLNLSTYATQPKIKGGKFSEKMCGTARTMTRAQIARAAGVSVRQVDRVLQPSTDGKYTTETETKVHSVVRSVDEIMRWHPDRYEVDTKLCFALGLYAADGSCASGFVTWSLHKDTKIVAARKVLEFTTALGLTCGQYRKGKYSLSLNCSSRWLVAMFRDLCPGVARTKRLPSWIWSLSRACRASILEGMYRGDGNWHPKTAHLRLTTMSPHLAMQARDLWLSLDIPASITTRKVVKRYKGTLRPQSRQGKPVFSSERIYNVGVCGSHAQAASAVLGLSSPAAATRARGTQFVRISEGVYGVRVSKVTKKRAVVEVHDLQVERSESFIANGVVVHNCPLQARACGVPVAATVTTGHSAGHAEGPGVVPIRQVDDLEPIDDGPGAVAPPVFPADIAEAIAHAHANWPELSRFAETLASDVAHDWSWENQLAPLVELLR